MDYSLNKAAELLNISPRTLRRWNEHFDPLLSGSAHQAHMAGGSAAPLRYTEADIAILRRAKALIWSGCSYAEVLHRLTGAEADAQSDEQAAKQRQSLDKQPSHNGGEHDQQLQLAGQVDDIRKDQAQVRAENQFSGRYRASWRGRISDRLIFQLVIVISICVVAILVAIVIVWLAARILTGGGDNVTMTIVAVGLAAMRSGQGEQLMVL